MSDLFEQITEATRAIQARWAGRPSIGIILCAEKDNLEVEFSLKTKANPIGVAEYRLQSQLPAALQGKLPTPEQLDAAVRSVLPAKRRR